MGNEKSKFCSRSDVIEIAAIPKLALLPLIAESSSGTLEYSINLDSTPIWLAMLRQRSILNPDSSPLFDSTKGGITRVPTNNGCWSFGDCWGSGFWDSPGDAINNNAKIPPTNPIEVYSAKERLVLFLQSCL